MTSRSASIRWGAIVLGTIVLLTPLAAGIDVKVEHDKTFNFKAVKTWAWDPKDHGGVRMARTALDDPAAMQKRTEPIIFDAVATEMQARRVEQTTGVPDVHLTYYLLLTTNISSQTMGQFLPATTAWGLPPFPPATQALKGMNRGSLVLDAAAGGKVVWRGVARTDLEIDVDNKKREEVLRKGIHELVRRFPPR